MYGKFFRPLITCVYLTIKDKRNFNEDRSMPDNEYQLQLCRTKIKDVIFKMYHTDFLPIQTIDSLCNKICFHHKSLFFSVRSFIFINTEIM